MSTLFPTGRLSSGCSNQPHNLRWPVSNHGITAQTSSHQRRWPATFHGKTEKCSQRFFKFSFSGFANCSLGSCEESVTCTLVKSALRHILGLRMSLVSTSEEWTRNIVSHIESRKIQHLSILFIYIESSHIVSFSSFDFP